QAKAPRSTTVPTAPAERKELAVPAAVEPAPREPQAANELKPLVTTRPPTEPAERSPGTLEPANEPGPPAKEAPAKAPPPSTEPPSSTGAAPPPKSSAPPTTEVKPPAKEPPTEPSPGSRTLFQEVLVARRPSFDVSGVTISQDLQYRVISKLLVA